MRPGVRETVPEAGSGSSLPPPARRRYARSGFYLLLAVAAFYLLAEHRVHVAASLRWLPLLLLLACPLSHLLGHHGPRSRHHGGGDDDSSSRLHEQERES